MKALSIRQPWAELIMDGRKKFENRSWRTNYRGPLIIHASMQHDWKAGEFMLQHKIALQGEPARGAVLGVVQLLGCQHIDEMAYPDKFAFGPWCWIIARPQRLPKPIPYLGRQSLFEITDSFVLEQLPQ